MKNFLPSSTILLKLEAEKLNTDKTSSPEFATANNINGKVYKIKVNRKNDRVKTSFS